MAGLTGLIPLDGTDLSESALELLPCLQRLGFDKVRLISVWDESHEASDHADSSEAAEKGRAYLEAYLEKQAEAVRGRGLQVECLIRLGKAAEQILEAAEQGTDLILIATHGRTGIARLRLGSVADKVVRDTGCPVLVIGPNVKIDLAAYAPRRIMVPLDGSELAEQALPVVSWLAAALDTEIDIVRTVMLPPMAADASAYPTDILSSLEDAARTYVAQKAKELAGRMVEAYVRVGSTGERLLEHLEERPAELVVMASHGRSGFVRAALGSITDRVLHGPAPVLVLKPESETKGGLLAAARSAR
jgi:nucleotide-binding universal stress UspA family protein